MDQKPSVAIITVVYNAESVVERTMKSVANQTWPNIQHMVIDGKSSDATLSIVNKFSRPELVVFSEKDKGIYDAMNKGLNMAKADYILFLNAGDELYSDATIADMFAVSANADFYFGNTAVMNHEGTILGDRRLSPPENLTWRSLQRGMVVSHQSVMVKTALAVQYDLSYQISADIDWTIRTLRSCKSIVNTHIYVSRFLEGGVSSSRRKQGLKERFFILAKHYGWLNVIWNHMLIVFRFVWHFFTRKSMT
jgi:glycosyltransferase involved in cell wall biosynthesis